MTHKTDIRKGDYIVAGSCQRSVLVQFKMPPGVISLITPATSLMASPQNLLNLTKPNELIMDKPPQKTTGEFSGLPFEGKLYLLALYTIAVGLIGYLVFCQ